MENKRIFQFIDEHLQQNKKVALVTVTQTSGSSPASIGQMMAVLKDGSIVGTVGGGLSEFTLIQEAMQVLQESTTNSVIPFAHDHTQLGMACGGTMSGFIHVLGNEDHLYIFGGGHVAQSLAPVAKLTGFAVTVIEDRPEFRDAFPDAQYIVATPDEYKEKVALLGTPYVVITTRGHRADQEALDYVIDKETKYVGMIGSRSKVASVFEYLKNRGCSTEKLQSVHTPIGLNIANAIPAEIAISIMAEILMVKNNGTPEPKSYANEIALRS